MDNLTLAGLMGVDGQVLLLAGAATAAGLWLLGRQLQRAGRPQQPAATREGPGVRQPLLSKEEAKGEEEEEAAAPGAAPAGPQPTVSGGLGGAGDEHEGSTSLLAVGTPEQREADAVIAAATAAAAAAAAEAAAAQDAEVAAAAEAAAPLPGRAAVAADVAASEAVLAQQPEHQAAAAEDDAAAMAAAAEEAAPAAAAAAAAEAEAEAAAAVSKAEAAFDAAVAEEAALLEAAEAEAEAAESRAAAEQALAGKAAAEQAAAAAAAGLGAERQHAAALLPAVLATAELPADEVPGDELAPLELPAALLELPAARPEAAPPAGLSAAAGSAGSAGSSPGESIDPSDVAPGALGSPFVPPWLTPAPGSQSSGPRAPPPMPFVAAASLGFPGMGAGQSAEAALDAAAAALGEGGTGGFSSSGHGGSGAAGPPAAPAFEAFGAQRPRHRRKRSLLSESLEDEQRDAVLAGIAEHAQHGPAPGELGAEPKEPPFPAGEQQWAAGVSAMDAEEGAAAAAVAAQAAAAAAAQAGPAGGRLAAGLRVELPEELEARERQRQQQQWEAQQQQQWEAQQQQQQQQWEAQRQQQVGAPLPQQAQQTPPPAETPGDRGAPTPLGFAQQQALAAAAAAEAAAAAAALQAQQQRQQQPAGDSVAAALQRAVDLANARPSSLPGGFSGFQAVPGQHGVPPAHQLRATLSGGTFRAAAPPGAGPGGGYPGGASMPLPGFSSSGAAGRYGGAGLQQEGGDSAWGDFGGMGFSMLAERSSSSRSDRHLPRLSEEVEGVRSSMDVDVPLACKLDVIAGPCSGRAYTNTEDVLEIIIGRNATAHMQLNDGEVSGQHVAVRWSSVDKCWKVADLGSLNGTLLNGEPISVSGRKRGRDYRLSADDILQLGSFTKIKVSSFPRDLLDPLQSRCGSLPVGSMPKSLTMPKHRIPSFSSLLSPKITNTPSKKATVAAASDELRLECCIISRTGRDHQRKGQTCEDVACAECPLHGSEEALGGTPAALFCVFDGHCGRAAADAASTALPDEVSKRLAGVREQLAAAAGAEDMLRSAFLATDQAISAEEGCTATAVLMWRDGQGDVCLQAANVGDSSAFFIDPATGQSRELTEDHRLTNPRERQRLQDMGIQLASNARRLYGLNLCRGLGDKFLKDEDLGLSAEPSVSGVVRLGEQEGGILLIASDGLWDVADQEAVTQAICQADRDKDGNVLETTNAVIALALKHRTKDDVTALVVRVWPATEWELRSPTKNLDDGEAAAFVVG